jgi:Flp pilus assembly protein CpaB
MDMKKSLPLIVAGTLGVGAFIAARQMAAPAPAADPSASVKWVEIPTAARDIDPGQLLGESDIVTLKVDERVMGGAVIPQAQLLVGRVASAPIGKGSLFTSSMLAADGSAPGLAA